MSEYKPNSHKYKDEQKKVPEKRVQKVISTNAKVKKTGGFKKFLNNFVEEDADSVKNYIVADVVIPAAKKLISDIVRDGIDMILYGGTNPRKTGSSGSKISYRNFYDDKRDDRHRPTTSTRFDYDNVGWDSRGAADAAIAEMSDIIDVFGFVTVSDLYEMANLSAPYTSNKYGWMSVSTAEVYRGRDGMYYIKLPKASPID